MPSGPFLLTQDKAPFATGRAGYRDSIPEPEADQHGPDVVVRIKPQPLDFSVFAVVDTAAPWCILEPGIGYRLMDFLEPTGDPVILSTRLGFVRGNLYRGVVTLIAQEGKDLEIDATIFLSPDWRGGNFIGYEGMLERARFAVDPGANLFYFGEVGR